MFLGHRVAAGNWDPCTIAHGQQLLASFHRTSGLAIQTLHVQGIKFQAFQNIPNFHIQFPIDIEKKKYDLRWLILLDEFGLQK